jgi:hypothetical protein
MSGIWIRAGRGAAPDPNLSLKKLADVRKALVDMGVELWGWHVPLCANSTAARQRPHFWDWCKPSDTHRTASGAGTRRRTTFGHFSSRRQFEPAD